MNIPRGTLRPDYYITCGGCEYGFHVGESVLKKAQAAARDMGWKDTRSRGWLCPDCARVEPKKEKSNGTPRRQRKPGRRLHS